MAATGCTRLVSTVLTTTYRRNTIARLLSRRWGYNRVMTMLASKPKSVRTTRFSEFIRKAPAREKKRVYRRVLERASERQRRILESARRP